MIRYVFAFYLILTVFFLAVIELTTITLMTGALGIFVMWALYLPLLIGYSAVGRRYSSHNVGLEFTLARVFRRPKTSSFYGVCSIILSIVCMRYYTGLWPGEALLHWVESNSVYSSYQEHYNANVSGVSTFSKLPYILFQAVIFLMFLTAALVHRIDTVIPVSTKRIFLFLCLVSFLYMGFARGTNFEIFVVANVYGFILFSRSNRRITRSVFIFSTVVFFAALFFQFSLSIRGWMPSQYITSDVSLYKHSLIYEVAPWAGLMMISLYGYFGHGLNFISNFFSNVMLDDHNGSLVWFLPQQGLLFDISAVESTEVFVSLGIRWVPAMIDFMETFGLVGLFLLCFIFGVIARIAVNTGGVVGQIVQFLVAFVMISLPLGSFYGISYVVIAALFSVMIILSRVIRF